MPTTNLDDLIAVVQSIRGTLHPDLDARFVQAVILAEEANAEDDSGAIREIEAAVRQALGSGNA